MNWKKKFKKKKKGQRYAFIQTNENGKWHSKSSSVNKFKNVQKLKKKRKMIILSSFYSGILHLSVNFPTKRQSWEALRNPIFYRLAWLCSKGSAIVHGGFRRWSALESELTCLDSTVSATELCVRSGSLGPLRCVHRKSNVNFVRDSCHGVWLLFLSINVF